jgi:hypothetical protein
MYDNSSFDPGSVLPVAFSSHVVYSRWSVMLVPIYHAAWDHISEDHNLSKKYMPLSLFE